MTFSMVTVVMTRGHSYLHYSYKIFVRGAVTVIYINPWLDSLW